MLRAKLRGLIWRRKLECELDEELAFHRARLAEKAADERRRFGNELRLREDTRAAWMIGWLEALGQDLRVAARSLRHSPGYATAVILTLALGIGANSAIFSLAYGVMWKPLPYPQPSKLIALRQGYGHWNNMMDSAWDMTQARAAHTGLHDWVIYRASFQTLTGTGEPELLPGAEAEAGVFQVLGVKPLAGRFYTSADDTVGGPPVIVISEALWRKHFGGDRNLIGKVVMLDGKPETVIGVMPAWFQFPGKLTAYWRPWQEPAASGGDRDVNALARLAPGVTLVQAQHELDLEMARLAQVQSSDKGWRFIARPLLQEEVGGAAAALWLMVGVVGFVLLISAANVSCLLLARAQRRERELATRAALGASRARLARYLLTETVLLVSGGAALGLATAWAGIAWLRSAAPASMPRLDNVSLSWPVVGFTAAVAVAAGALFGLAPAWRASAPTLQGWLKGVSKAQGSGRARGRGALVSAQIGLAVLLLVGAGLLLKAMQDMLEVPLGFDPEHVLTFYAAPPPAAYPKEADWERFYERAVGELAAIHGVQGAAVAAFLPFNGTASTRYSLPDRPLQPNDHSQEAGFNVISPDYFSAMRIPVRAGRVFAASDTKTTAEVAVIDEAMAHSVFAGKNPIGQRIRFSWGGEPWRVVVGVVGNVQLGLTVRPAPALPYAYVPMAQAYIGNGTQFVARTVGEPTAILPEVRRAMAGLDRSIPIDQVETMAQLYGDALAEPRFRGDLVAAFAGLALLLTAVGLYGLLSYSVAGRTAEFGVRSALGALPRQVMGLVLRQALWLVAVGAAAGLLASWILTRLVADMLFGVSPTDPTVLAAVVGVIVAVGVAAAWGPARRAMRVDAARALREG